MPATSPETTAPGASLGRYFFAAYAISWGGVALAALTLDGPARLAAMIVAMLAGPPVAALLATPAGGRRRLFLTGWGGAGWPALAAGYALAPAALLAVLLPLALIDPAFRPEFRPWMLLAGFLPAICEEIGWTGLAAPQLLARMKVRRAGLLLGAVWALWHMAADFAGNVAATGALWPVQFLVFWVLTLIPFRLMMVRAFARTGSRAMAVAMHAGYTGGLLALQPAMEPAQALAWQAPFAALLWLLALAPFRRG